MKAHVEVQGRRGSAKAEGTAKDKGKGSLTRLSGKVDFVFGTVTQRSWVVEINNLLLITIVPCLGK